MCHMWGVGADTMAGWMAAAFPRFYIHIKKCQQKQDSGGQKEGSEIRGLSKARCVDWQSSGMKPDKAGRVWEAESETDKFNWNQVD